MQFINNVNGDRSLIKKINNKMTLPASHHPNVNVLLSNITLLMILVVCCC